MSFNIPQTPSGGDLKNGKHLIYNHKRHSNSKLMINTPPDSSKRQKEGSQFLNDLIDVSELDDINSILEENEDEDELDDQATDIMIENTFSRLDRATKGVTPTDISTEADGWMDDVFNSNIYGINETSELMPNQIFLDDASPNNDLTPDSVISPLEFSTQLSNTAVSAPLSDKTNIINQQQQQHTPTDKKTLASPLVMDSSMKSLIIEGLLAFIDYFFNLHKQRLSDKKHNIRIIPRNEYISEFLVKNHGINCNRRDITKILNVLKINGKNNNDNDLVELIAYTDKLKKKSASDFTSLRILANFSNPLLKHSPKLIARTPSPRPQNQRESSVSSLNAVDQLSIVPKKLKNEEPTRFELHKFKILFNYHNGNSFKFSEFDREDSMNSGSCTEIDNIDEIRAHVQLADNCINDLCKSPLSNNFLVCNASLLLNEVISSSSPSMSTKKKNFDLSLGNFISSVELLYHVPRQSDASTSSSILNYQSSISIYNKNQLIHQKMEPIIGFKINPQLVNHDTYNLKIPFQSNFWGGYLTWLLNGSDDDKVSDIVIAQTIMDDDAHGNQNLVTLLWNFNDDSSSPNSVTYKVFSLGKDEQPLKATKSLSNKSSSSIAPIMDSRLISTVITGDNGSNPQLLHRTKASHKRTRSKSFSELEQLQFEQQQQQQQLMPNNNLFAPHYPQRLNLDFDPTQQQLFMNQDISSAPASQQNFPFFPPNQPFQQLPQHSQSANNSPYMMQPNGFPQQQQQQQFMPPTQRPMNFKSQSFTNIPTYNQMLMMQQPPMRFINVPGPVNTAPFNVLQQQQQQQQMQLPTPPATMAPFTNNGFNKLSLSSTSRKSSLPTPTTPSIPQQQLLQSRIKQHIFVPATDKPSKATRQLSNSSTSSVSSSSTIPFDSSPNHTANTNFKKLKGNFDQLLKIEFYQPPKS